MINQNNNKTIDFRSIGLSQTSKGVLLKWTDDEKYYKSGSLHYGIFRKIEPVTECICSEIRALLGLHGVDYNIESIKTRGCEDFEEQEILCCVSENFLKEDETLITFAKHYKNYKGKLTYEKVIDDFPQFKEEINKMLIFDFIVNNIDRHFNNFGYIINGSMKYCPIFDNGLSLYSDLNTEELKIINNNKYSHKKFDKSKPFASKHKSQIQLINELPIIDLSHNNEDFLDIIIKYKEYLGAERVKAICNLIEMRLNYVREIYANV